MLNRGGLRKVVRYGMAWPSWSSGIAELLSGMLDPAILLQDVVSGGAFSMDLFALDFLLFLALYGTGAPNDLVSCVKPEDYFQSRAITVTGNEMVRLAGKEPKDGTASFQQLLALRWLAEHPAELKKEKEARKLLEGLAEGASGDAQGFAREYAAAALAIIDGKAPGVRTMPASSVINGLSWFPEKAGVFGGLDFRVSTDTKTPPDDTLRNLLRRMVLFDNVQNAIYSFGDAVGNVRIDRVSFAFLDDPQGTVYFRLTGLADHVRLARQIHKLQGRDSTVKRGKGANGEPITIMELGGGDWAVALIQDTELLVATYEPHYLESRLLPPQSPPPPPPLPPLSAPGAAPRRVVAEGRDLLRDVLAVRATGKGGVTAGPKAELLRRVPATASVLLVGHLRESLRSEFTRRQGWFATVPDSFVLEKTTGKEIEIHLYGTFDKPEDAKSFADSAAELKQQFIASVKSMLEDTKIKKEAVALLVKTLEGITSDADGKGVRGEVRIAPEIIRHLGSEFVEAFLREMPSEQQEP
jgi:hypothetical protein